MIILLMKYRKNNDDEGEGKEWERRKKGGERGESVC
jgi:hypothetical protein